MTDYTPADPTMASYDHAVGTLKIDGELRGHLTCVLRHIAFPMRAPWLWFVVVWPDGSKENPFEDYGPAWWNLRELDAGRFEGHGPSSRSERRFLGRRISSSLPGAPLTFDFAWLSADQARAKWSELGLVDSDF